MEKGSYTFEYDSLGRPIRSYEYDGSGNLIQSIEQLYDEYSRLTAQNWVVGDTPYSESYTYNDPPEEGEIVAAGTPQDGSPIVYEGQTYSGGIVSGTAISGNPIHYTNGIKTYTDLTWEHGRQLASLTTGNKTYTYDYDAEGIRTQKVVDGVVHTYITQNGKVVQESFPYGNTTVIMIFTYDEQGKPFSLRYSYDGGASFAQYYYATNAQGDVEGIFFTRKNATTGKQEIRWMGYYTYDAWGNVTSIMDAGGYTPTSPANLMNRNPLRYRGYYYDTETGLYYVSSRYYDPEIGRWINADNVIPDVGSEILGYNMFAYCFNNPVSMDDQSGHWPKWLKNAAKAVASVVTQVKAVLSIPSTVVKIAAASTVAVVSRNATVGDVVNDVKKYSFFNTDETKVLDSEVFSSYKGTPVLKHDISWVTSFSISNTIILNKGENVSNGGVDTVKHEWGHTVQQSIIGTNKYMTRIAIPSVISCYLNPSSKIYYSLPWERSAEFFGGVSRTTGYYEGSDVVAGLYLIAP